MSRAPRPILYTVTASLPTEKDATDYLRWLFSGHIDAVKRCGAACGMVARLDGPSPPIEIEVTYGFEDRAAFERYDREHAPALRAEGLSVFGPRGVSFHRRLAVIEAGP